MQAADKTSTQENATAPPPPEAATESHLPAVRPDPPAPPAAARRRLWLWMGAGLLGLAIAILASSQMWMALPPAVGVEIAALAPVTRVLAVNGRIAAVHSVDIRSAVSGKLAALPVAEGDLVEAGQTLAQVDAAAQNSIVRQAKAGLDAALVTQQQAVEAYDRAVALGNNVARTVLEDTAHGVQSAAQEVARMTAFLDQASSVLRDHATRAPIAGSVVDLYVERGQIVGPSTPLLTLADLNDLVVEADVDEAYATQIDVMQPAVMQLPGETGTHDGHVSFVSTRVNASTGGLAVKIAFEAPVMLPIGLTVATNIVVDRRDAALTAPRTAIMTSEKGTEVFVVVDGTAHRRAVTVVEWPAARLIVTAGLVEGDMMVTDATGIKDGQAVALDLP